MAVSYKRLWKLLVDKEMSKSDLRKKAEIAPILRTDWIYSKYIAAYAALLTFFEHENVLSSTSLMS